MTPEQLKQMAEMQAQISEVVEFINKLGNVGEVPLDVGNALAARILKGSTKTAASATRAVNEGGVAQYSVMYPPTGFIEANLNGKVVNVPYI